MYATGWQQLTQQKDLSLDAPTSKWGYADDVVADYFADEVLRMSAAGRPFLAGLLTLSSHEPFEVPFTKFDDKVLNAMAFTDDCLGRMIDRWKASPAWDELLVVLVADHGYAYPYGLAYNAPLRHRIPMIWLGGGRRTPHRGGVRLADRPGGHAAGPHGDRPLRLRIQQGYFRPFAAQVRLLRVQRGLRGDQRRGRRGVGTVRCLRRARGPTRRCSTRDARCSRPRTSISDCAKIPIFRYLHCGGRSLFLCVNYRPMYKIKETIRATTACAIWCATNTRAPGHEPFRHRPRLRRQNPSPRRARPPPACKGARCSSLLFQLRQFVLH